MTATPARSEKTFSFLVTTTLVFPGPEDNKQTLSSYLKYFSGGIQRYNYKIDLLFKAIIDMPKIIKYN